MNGEIDLELHLPEISAKLSMYRWAPGRKICMQPSIQVAAGEVHNAPGFTSSLTLVVIQFLIRNLYRLSRVLRTGNADLPEFLVRALTRDCVAGVKRLVWLQKPKKLGVGGWRER